MKNLGQKAQLTKQLTALSNKMIKEQKNTIIETENNGIVVSINANGDLEKIYIEDTKQAEFHFEISKKDLEFLLKVIENMFNKIIPKIQEKRQEIVKKYSPEIERITEILKNN